MSNEKFSSKVNLFLNQYRSVVRLDSIRWKRELHNARARFDRRRKKYDKEEPLSNPDRDLNRVHIKRMDLFIKHPR